MYLKNDKYFEIEYYHFNFRLFQLIGFGSYETSLKQLMHVYFINLMLAVGSFIQIYTVFTSELKVEPITKSLEMILPSLCFESCYYNFSSNTATMRKILYRIKWDWDKLTNETELIILKRYANQTRLYTIIIAIAFYLYIAFLTLPSVVCILLYCFNVANETELILPICLNNYLRDRMNYYFIFLSECAFLLILSTIGIANYSMFVLIVQHTCALFNIVAWKIEERFEKNPQNFYHACVDNKIVSEYKWIVNIIEFYDNAIDFANLMTLYYEKSLLWEGLLSIFFITINYLYLFQLLSFTVNMSEGLKKCNYIIGSTFVIYIHCYLGQKLIDHHTEIFMKLCQIPFYLLSLKTQKMLLFLIMKSMRPCNLSIKGVIIISHYIFTTLMRTAFSYAMVFYNSFDFYQEK